MAAAKDSMEYTLEARSDRMSMGRKLLTQDEIWDMVDLWTAALELTDYKPYTSKCATGYTNDRNYKIELDIMRFALESANRLNENQLAKITEKALEGGIDSMLDSYFAGVPVADIIG